MKLVVTGATGHLGHYAVDRLASAGHEVVAVSRSGAVPPAPFGRTPREPLAAALRLDLGEESCVAPLTAALAGAGALVHLAAWHPEQTARTGRAERRRLLEVNVHGTLRALEAARASRVPLVVYASSFEVYGDASGDCITEAERVEPITDYGASKLAGEDHLLAFAYEQKARVVALRMPAVYGPGEKTPRALPNFLSAVARGEVPVIQGDGEDLRDELHVADAARAILLALSGTAHGIFNIADGERHSIAELAKLALEVAGNPAQPLRQPRAKPRRDYHMSIAKARAELGFTPSVSLRDGMAEQLAWLRGRARAP
jgi:nucleoside-diphosphate-sugar epimerase